MLKSSKKLKNLVLTSITALLLLAICLSVSTVSAQGNATVTVLGAIGGTTSPAAGTYTDTAGSSYTFTATPASSFYVFSYWIISSSASGATTSISNPLTTTFTATTYSIQPVYTELNFSYPIPLASPPTTTDAIVIVLSAVGGTVSPGPGTYDLSNASALSLTATAASGWKFDNWVIGGYPLSHGAYTFTDTPTNNPYDVDHGYGYTYSYQPVFSLISTTTSPTPTVPEFSNAAEMIVTVALIAVLVVSGVYAYNRRKQ